MRQPPLSVVRRHGLGNVLQLLPILRSAAVGGRCVELVTRREWLGALSRVAPDVVISAEPGPDSIDLDALTLASPSTENRSVDFMRRLGIGELAPPPLIVPDEWRRRWSDVAGMLVFAPEAANPARQCPAVLANSIGETLFHRGLVVVGQDRSVDIPCRLDLRGRTTLEDLFGIVAQSAAVISMDSAMLHLAAIVGTPTVALFGGINPESRTRQDQHVTVLLGDVPCRPCNKNETCDGAFHCLHRFDALAVQRAVDGLAGNTGRTIRLV